MRKFYVEEVKYNFKRDKLVTKDVVDEDYVRRLLLSIDERLRGTSAVDDLINKIHLGEPYNGIDRKKHPLDGYSLIICNQKCMLDLRSERMQAIHREYSHLQLKFDELVENLDV